MNANITVNPARRGKQKINASWLKSGMVLTSGARVLSVDNLSNRSFTTIEFNRGGIIDTATHTNSFPVEIFV